MGVTKVTFYYREKVPSETYDLHKLAVLDGIAAVRLADRIDIYHAVRNKERIFVLPEDRGRLPLSRTFEFNLLGDVIEGIFDTSLVRKVMFKEPA